VSHQLDNQWVCAGYFSKNRPEVVGFLPSSQLKQRDPKTESLPIDRWVGHWENHMSPKQLVGVIDITQHDGSCLGAVGQAYWYGPTTVNTGNIGFYGHDGKPDELVYGIPQSNKLRLQDGTDGSSCQITLTLLGDVLAVVDNGHCGGLNVSFNGFYHKKRPRR
jgi:hypothetical protein